MPKWVKALLWVIGALVVLLIIVSFFRGGDDSPTTSFAEVLAEARAGNVERIDVHGTRLEIIPADGGEEYDSRIGDETDLLDELRQEGIAIGGPGGIDVRFRTSGFGRGGAFFLAQFIPTLIIVAGVYFIVRNAVREGMRQGRS